MRWLKKTEWQATEATVTDVEVINGQWGPVYDVAFNYKVGEHWYGGHSTSRAARWKGDTIPIRYDPADPDRNRLPVSSNRARVWIIVVMVLVVVRFVATHLPWSSR